MSVHHTLPSPERAALMVERHLLRRKEHAVAWLAEAEKRLAEQQEVLVAFEEEGVVPEEAARRVWLRAADDASTASLDVIYQGADRSVFDECRDVREAVRRGLTGLGFPPLPEEDDEVVVGGSAGADDAEITRRRIAECLRERIAQAHDHAAVYRTAIAGLAAAVETLRDTGRLPVEYVEEIWHQADDAVAEQATRILEGNGDVDAFHRAKDDRAEIHEWLRDLGYAYLCSGQPLADLPEDIVAEAARAR